MTLLKLFALQDCFFLFHVTEKESKRPYQSHMAPGHVSLFQKVDIQGIIQIKGEMNHPL